MSTLKPLRPIVVCGLAGMALATLSLSCRKPSDQSDVKYAVTLTPSQSDITEALKSRVAFQVNLQTNRITYFKEGKLIGQWNIASADVKGEFHNGEMQVSPEGVFRADALEACPGWYPLRPKGPDGNPVKTEEERWEVFAAKKNIYGPCGADNPLGKYAIWFNGPYALHGNAAEWIMDLPNPEERRVSGGCIRNPNEKIKYVFEEMLNTFPELKDYAAKVSAQAAATGDKVTLEQDVTSLPITVIVGRWSADPKPNNNPQQNVTPTPTPTPAAPTGFPKNCTVTSIEPSMGIVRLWASLPANRDSYSAFADLGDDIQVLSESGEYYKMKNRSKDWSINYAEKKYITCK